ncbi:MAG: acetoacetate decarboxylase family protein [Gemmatimonadetes bacterium]|nr:acetoacetate decarboxylase family protein [Gemmatimonadota bacterium]
MAPRYARPGTIPEAGEVWQPVGPTATLLTAHLVPVEAVRPLVPEGIEVVSVLPGHTLASTLLSYYGPGSTLVYHELVVGCAYVKHAGAHGFFVSHIYVDSADSVTGGRRMGLPKEMAQFNWNGAMPGEAVVIGPEGILVRVRYGRPLLRVPFSVTGGTVSVLDSGEVVHFKSRIRGRWGFAGASLDVPANSPLARVQLGQPVVSLVSGPMMAEMGLEFRAVGQVRRRSRPLLAPVG